MKELKFILLIITLAITSGECFSQSKKDEAYSEFTVSFPKAIRYPSELYKSCTSTSCLLKVEVNGSKDISSMKLSDSADSLLNNEFILHWQSLDIKALEKYLKGEYAGSSCTTFLIPLSYTILPQSTCPIASVKSKVSNDYFKFNGIYIGSEVILLKPTGFLTGVQQ